MGLIADLKQSREQGKTAIYILGTYGIQDEAELKTPLNQLRSRIKNSFKSTETRTSNGSSIELDSVENEKRRRNKNKTV